MIAFDNKIRLREELAMANKMLVSTSQGEEFTFTFTFDGEKLVSVTAVDGESEYDCHLQLKRKDRDESARVCCQFINGQLFCEPWPCP